MPHRRRFLTTTTRSLALGSVALFVGCGAIAQPSYTVPLSQLQEMVATKFPRSVPVQGLFDLNLQAPQLRLLPDVNRLGAAMGWRWPARRCAVPTRAVSMWSLRCATRPATARCARTRSSWGGWNSPRSSRP